MCVCVCVCACIYILIYIDEGSLINRMICFLFFLFFSLQAHY